MPNHYTNIITAIPKRGDNGEPVSDIKTLATNMKAWATDLLSRVLPIPPHLRDPDPIVMSNAQYHWCRENWGTKRDTFDATDPVPLPGDCGAMIVAFSTAWSPPNKAARTLAIADAKARGIMILSWVGLDPYNNTASNLFTRSR